MKIINKSDASIEVLVNQYKNKYLYKMDSYLNSYKTVSFDDALSIAANALYFAEDKYKMSNHSKAALMKHPHQFHINKDVFTKVEEALKDNSHIIYGIKAAGGSFEDLFETIKRIIYGISGVGELMLYDTTLRIGANIGILPNDFVYIHRGTREGLYNLLNIKTNNRVYRIDINTLKSKLPADLNAFHIENFLCIFKNMKDSKLKSYRLCSRQETIC